MAHAASEINLFGFMELSIFDGIPTILPTFLFNPLGISQSRALGDIFRKIVTYKDENS